MKKITISFLFCLFAFCGFAQKQAPKLEDVCAGKYYAERIYGVNPLNDGESYSQISEEGTRILRYSFKTGEMTGVLFDAATARDYKIEQIDGYIMSPDESRILIQTKTHPIYRHSFTAEYYIFSMKNNKLEQLSENGPQQVPLFSPDGNNIAFVRNNNIFLIKLLFDNSESQVTTDGKINEVLNGIPDWVNEEEFGYARAFDFTADSKMIAYIRFDESKVPLFTIPLYKGMDPALQQYADYPGNYEYKYPIAGMNNSIPTVHTFDIKSHVTRQMDLQLAPDDYIAGIQATPDENAVAIMTLNRHQDRFDLYMGDPRSCICKMVYRDEDSKYINEDAYRQIRFYKNNFGVLSEKDGFQHLYWYTLSGDLVKQVTTGSCIVTKFHGWDEANNTFYVTETDGTPLRTATFKVEKNGEMTNLNSKQKGTNDAIFSKNFHFFMNTYSNINTPPIITLMSHTGEELKVLLTNESLRNDLKTLAISQKMLFSFTTSEGIELNGWMMRPADFDTNKKYKVLMFQYGGPGSQQVRDSWYIGGLSDGGMWESILNQMGFIVVCVDGRGTGGRGTEFEKCTYLNLGAKEAQDQVETALWLGKQGYVDKNNIAIWGWSFGGFNTLMAMSEGRPVFKAGVAVAAPTSWKFYDTIYTERYMRTPKENGKGYEDCPISRAPKLNGSLLLVHGLADDNVHFRNCAEYSEALVQANKQFQMQTYTNRTHSIRGGNTRLHLFTRITNFLDNEMKN